MADVISGKMWTLGSGTLGLVTSNNVQIDKIRVTWSGASDGNVKLYSVKGDDNTSDALILNYVMVGAASGTAVMTSLTREFDFGGQEFKGITKTAMTGVDAEIGVQIQTK